MSAILLGLKHPERLSPNKIANIKFNSLKNKLKYVSNFIRTKAP